MLQTRAASNSPYAQTQITSNWDSFEHTLVAIFSCSAALIGEGQGEKTPSISAAAALNWKIQTHWTLTPKA